MLRLLKRHRTIHIGCRGIADKQARRKGRIKKHRSRLVFNGGNHPVPNLRAAFCGIVKDNDTARRGRRIALSGNGMQHAGSCFD